MAVEMGRKLLLILMFTAFLFAESAKADSDAVPTSGYSVQEFARALQLNSELSRSPQLSGSRKDYIDTDLGPVLLRQPAGFEATLKVRPIQLVRQAWNAASQFLDTVAFPSTVRAASYGWNIVVVSSPGLRVEGSKVSSEYCHTALMGPPADVLIDGYRLFHPCNVTDSMPSPEQRLLRSLTHEVGHGLEYKLLGSGFSRRQRWHSEGFASWFESEAANFLPGAKAGSLRREMLRKARTAFRRDWRPYFFSGSPEDYSHSFALVDFLVQRGGPEGLLRVYETMSKENCAFAEAVEKSYGLTFEDWMSGTEAGLESDS